nr:sensor histidine kinase [Reichenbachiella agariperforans]
MLRQVMTNLISNAIKYSSSQIRVVLTDLDKTVELSVIDQGIGIPENDQKHLFDKFFRAHNSHHIQGTGLGLNIVRKYLDLLEADIRFESEEGTGSTFTIILNK